MKILVGLGNPGEKYAANRHNVGFMFVEFFAKKYAEENHMPQLQWKFDKYANAESIKLPEFVLIKPQTFMNRSGESVRKVMINDKTIKATDLFIAHDDLDIPIGKFKIQQTTGPKLHNGLESIENAIGTKDFWRIRIGVENRPAENRMPGEAFVLQNFTEEEKNILTATFNEIYKRLLDL